MQAMIVLGMRTVPKTMRRPGVPGPFVLFVGSLLHVEACIPLEPGVPVVCCPLHERLWTPPHLPVDWRGCQVVAR